MFTYKITITNPITNNFQTFYSTIPNMTDAASSVINRMEDETPIRDLPNSIGDWRLRVAFL